MTDRLWLCTVYDLYIEELREFYKISVWNPVFAPVPLLHGIVVVQRYARAYLRERKDLRLTLMRLSQDPMCCIVALIRCVHCLYLHCYKCIIDRLYFIQSIDCFIL